MQVVELVVVCLLFVVVVTTYVHTYMQVGRYLWVVGWRSAGRQAGIGGRV